MRREAGRPVGGPQPWASSPKARLCWSRGALSIDTGADVNQPHFLPPRPPPSHARRDPPSLPHSEPLPGVPLPGTGLGPVEKVDPLSPLLGLEGLVEPITLGTDSATATWGGREGKSGGLLPRLQ